MLYRFSYMHLGGKFRHQSPEIVFVCFTPTIRYLADNPGPDKAQRTIEKALDKIAKEWKKHYKKAQ